MKLKIKTVILMSIRDWEHPVIFEAIADITIYGMLRAAPSFSVIILKWA